MSRNKVNSHFSGLPSVSIARSTFDRSSIHKTTFNAGKLVPIYVDELLPGDTVDMSVAALVRESTPIFPVMDDAFMDISFFAVPNRLVWDHWQEFMGENTANAWLPQVTYQVPQLRTGITSLPKFGGVCDHFGLPVGVVSGGLNYSYGSSLFHRAYRLIWNEYYRDQDLQDPVLINTGDNDDIINSVDDLLPVDKYADYFTSARPAPQKGPSVMLPIQGVPVVSRGTGIPLTPDVSQSLRWRSPDSSGGAIPVSGNLGVANGGLTGIAGTFSAQSGVAPSNLVVDPTLGTSIATINALRQAFQVQKLLERDLYGTRYIEQILAHFGVRSPDSRLQRPERLGSWHMRLNMEQVLQTSATDDVSPQGNTSGYSKTVGKQHMFTYSSTEHMILIGVACVRTKHTYQQGINRMFTRRDRFDFYYPEFANLGNQAIYDREIYADGGSLNSTGVFGYQEYAAEYRYKPSIVSGSFRHNTPQGSLDSWHYADWYESKPYLSADWIKEDKGNIDRTLAVSSDVSDQFLCDFYFPSKWTRPMPVYSIPGYADHH